LFGIQTVGIGRPDVEHRAGHRPAVGGTDASLDHQCRAGVARHQVDAVGRRQRVGVVKGAEHAALGGAALVVDQVDQRRDAEHVRQQHKLVA